MGQLDIFYLLRLFQSFLTLFMHLLKSLLAKMSRKAGEKVKKYGNWILLGHFPNFSKPSLIAFVSSLDHSFLVPNEVREALSLSLSSSESSRLLA